MSLYYWWQRVLMRILPKTRLGLALLLAALALLWFAPQIREAHQQQAHIARQPQFPELQAAFSRSMQLYDQGQFQRALTYAEKAAALAEEQLGPDHPNTAMSLNNLAMIYLELGRYAEAEPVMLRALVTQTKAAGPDDPGTAMALHNLAGLYDVQRRHDVAESYYRQALAVDLKALGPGHPDVVRIAGNYANMLRELGRHREAAAVEASAREVRAR